MVTNETLSADLEALARQAGDLARHARGDGDIPPKTLALALVETDKLSTRLGKLAAQLDGRKGKGKK